MGKQAQHRGEDDPDDQFRGDCWDHVAFDPEHRLVLTVIPGERTPLMRISASSWSIVAASA